MYKHINIVLLCLLYTISYSANSAQPATKIAIVSSYHKEYLWSQETSQGLAKALVELGYITNKQQADTFLKNDYIQTNDFIIKRWWMNTKKNNYKKAIEQTTLIVVDQLKAFKPTIIITGDDNATNYIGNAYIDAETPVVFWGINANPEKYNLIDSLEKPGHNITGVYQNDRLQESINFFTTLLPDIRTMTVISDDSVSSRIKAKRLKLLTDKNRLPVDILDIITTNSAEQWKQAILKSSKTSDALFILNYDTLKNKQHESVDAQELTRWYLKNVRIPEIAYGKRFIESGLLASDDDNGSQQSYAAVMMAHEILNGKKPGVMPVTAPKQTHYMVNIDRAISLGIYERIKNSPLVSSWHSNNTDQLPQ